MESGIYRRSHVIVEHCSVYGINEKAVAFLSLVHCIATRDLSQWYCEEPIQIRKYGFELEVTAPIGVLQTIFSWTNVCQWK